MKNIFESGSVATNSSNAVGKIPFHKTKVAKAVNSLLKSYSVKDGDTLGVIEKELGVINLGQNLLMGARSLNGQTLVFDGQNVNVLETRANFPVLAANDDSWRITGSK